MKYMGSKRRIAKHILPIMLQEAEKHGLTTWVEPFVGGGNMIDKVPNSYKRVGYDINKYLICMLNCLKKRGFIFNPNITREEYSLVRDYYNGRGDKNYNNDYVGWVGFMASANGRFFEGGYSGITTTKHGKERNYIDESVRGIKKQIKSLDEVDLVQSNYINLDFKDCLIYCDPPYKGSKSYSRESFNHDDFYNWCRAQAKNNIVFISEYDMPDDFIEVWRGSLKSSLSLNSLHGSSKDSVERLFMVKAV